MPVPSPLHRVLIFTQTRVRFLFGPQRLFRCNSKLCCVAFGSVLSSSIEEASSINELMAFVSFVGRVLFASVFILSAWQEFNEFGVDGGPAAKSLEPKFNVFLKHVSYQTGIQVPEVEIKHLVAAAITLKGLGGLLFIFGSSFGAYLLLLHQAIATPILYDFYNYDADKKEFGQMFTKFTQGLALFGALLFFTGMKNSMPRRQLRRKSPKSKTI